MSCCLEFIISHSFLYTVDTSIISLIICTCNNLQTIVMSLNHRKQYIYTQLQSFHNHMKYIYINIYLFYFKHICCIDCIHMTLQLHLPRSPTLGPYLVLGGRACYESWPRRSWTRRARNNNGWWIIYCNVYNIYIYIYTMGTLKTWKTKVWATKKKHKDL